MDQYIWANRVIKSRHHYGKRPHVKTLSTLVKTNRGIISSNVRKLPVPNPDDLQNVTRPFTMSLIDKTEYTTNFEEINSDFIKCIFVFSKKCTI